MGDRGHVWFREDENEDGVWVYTHDEGYRLPELVAAGLNKANGRWNDPSYLTRIVMSHLFGGYEDSLIGWGVASHEMDTSDGGRVVMVDLLKHTVTLVTGWGRADERWTYAGTYAEFSTHPTGWNGRPIGPVAAADAEGPRGNEDDGQRGRALAFPSVADDPMIGRQVRMIRGLLTGHDGRVGAEWDALLAGEGGHQIHGRLYAIDWPDGGGRTTVLRHEFEPID